MTHSQLVLHLNGYKVTLADYMVQDGRAPDLKQSSSSKAVTGTAYQHNHTSWSSRNK
jgi:hypothetical protein